MITMERLQQAVGRIWTLAGYTTDFRASRVPTRDFGHALGHVQKAAGRLFELVDAFDHGHAGPEQSAVEKCIADLVICAGRLANTAPTPVNLQLAVEARLREIAERNERPEGEQR